MNPELSVILVSDYGSEGDGASLNFGRTLRALARQTFRGPVEYLLVEQDQTADRLPPDLLDLLPGARILRAPQAESFALKNAGVRAAQAPYIVILDGDCCPGPQWLENIAAAWRAHPDAAVISGRTVYGGTTLLARLSSLLSRAYVDRGSAGETAHVSNNNATWKRSVLLEHPMPEGLGPFAQKIQSEGVIRSGGKLLFVPDFPVVHQFEGVRMEADLRKNCGYGTVISRLEDDRLPHAWLVRLKWLSIPLFWAGKTMDTWSDILRCWRTFGIRFLELPLALLAAPMVIALEIPGMMRAFGDREIGRTEYR